MPRFVVILRYKLKKKGNTMNFTNDDLNELKTAIESDYFAWMKRCGYNDNASKRTMNITFETKKKYIKIKRDAGDGYSSAWGFIVKEDDAKFKSGDLLKPKNYSSPTTNFARGNVNDVDNAQTTWPGL